MYPIKTITTLVRCLTADIPVFKQVCKVEFQVSRITLFKMSLLELWVAVGDEIYYTKLSKEAITHYIEVAAATKLTAKVAAAKPVVPNPPPVVPVSAIAVVATP